MKRVACLILAVLMVALCGCRDAGTGIRESSSSESSSEVETVVSSEPEESSSEPEPESEPEPNIVNISFVAAGDNLIHDTIYLQAAERADGEGYDFDYCYEEVEDLIAGHDIALLNQETLIASPPFAVSTYPMFSSPQELGEKMIELGFNSFNHANNHVLDKGIDGINATLDFWDTQSETHDIAVTGVWRDTADMENIKTLRVNGVTVAFLGFTQWLNGLSLPEGCDERIVTTDEEAEMQRLIEMANEIADVVIVSVHWGVENSNVIVDYQTNLAQKFVDWGVDLIIGTHPHVLQGMEYIEKEDGTNAICVYSLGNFISAQSVSMNLIGGVLTANIEYNFDTDTVDVKDAVMHPVVTQYAGGIKVYPLEKYTEELATENRASRSFLSNWSLDYIHGVVADVIPDEFLWYTWPEVEETDETTVEVTAAE